MVIYYSTTMGHVLLYFYTFFIPAFSYIWCTYIVVASIGYFLSLTYDFVILTAYATQQIETNFNTKPLASSRWNPTPEQILVLQELYQHGTRTPTADQIQQIAAYLRRFGKIEGKNVFYWFQNHKARERQKRRRELASHLQVQQHDCKSLVKKEPGTNQLYIHFFITISIFFIIFLDTIPLMLIQQLYIYIYINYW